MPQFLAAFEVGQSKVEEERRQQICRFGRWMYRRGLVVACQGNLSVRLDEDRILLTPAGACKGRLAPEDLLITDLSGAVLSGAGEPSSETQMHLLFYRERPEVHAVCHAHPPTATGFAAAGRALDQPVLPEIVADLGTIPLAPYGTPGTWEVCAGLEPLVAEHDAILLESHGVVTCGKDLATAYYRMETVEQFAKILLTARTLGGPRLLSSREVEKLMAAKAGRWTARPQGSVELPLEADARAYAAPGARRERTPFSRHRAQRRNAR
jgi:L-fuculose-phosphate aldolase